ncbi:MAG: hypothetical protein AAFX00_07380, partial [Pseudomonadota bacterium]
PPVPAPLAGPPDPVIHPAQAIPDPLWEGDPENTFPVAPKLVVQTAREDAYAPGTAPPAPLARLAYAAAEPTPIEPPQTTSTLPERLPDALARVPSATQPVGPASGPLPSAPTTLPSLGEPPTTSEDQRRLADQSGPEETALAERPEDTVTEPSDPDAQNATGPEQPLTEDIPPLVTVISPAGPDAPRPRPRPASIVPVPVAEAPPVADPDLPALARERPRPRPARVLALAAEAQAIRDGFVRPPPRPAGWSARVAAVQNARAAEKAAAASVATATASAAPAPAAAVPVRVPTRASVAREATEQSVLALNRLTLIGVSGPQGDRRALLRTGTGRILRVSLGDRLDGGQVVSIGSSTISYVKGGRTHEMVIPN